MHLSAVGFLDIAATLLALVYASIQGWFVLGWQRTPHVPGVHNASAQRPKWSVLIPARNESSKIIDCLLALKSQTFKDFEVIVIDDHSSDSTVDIAHAQQVEVLVLPKGLEGKKEALTFGIDRSAGQWIATLDADARPTATWLSSLDKLSEDYVAIAGPVMLGPAKRFFEKFQALDFCGMMLITCGSLHHAKFAMGNGANLAFTKKAFYKVNGYEVDEGKEAVSGDDMVLLGKLLRHYLQGVAFAKTADAVVETTPVQSLSNFVQQRWRWSAKTGLNLQPALTVTLGVTWLFHVGLLVGFILSAVGVLSLEVLVFAWVVKLVADFKLLKMATQFFERERLLTVSYPVMSFLHACYIAGIGTLALLPIQFEWKGRRASR